MKNAITCLAQARPTVRALVVAPFLLAPMARADVVPFVDNYKTNVSANLSPDTNAAIRLLSGYNSLWSAGVAWNTGAPTALGAPVIEASQAYVVNATMKRTAAQEESAYLTDRRNQSYSAINGLGTLAEAFRTAAGATTTITTVAPDANLAKYNDVGTGAGSSSSPTVGEIVSLVATLRGNYSSTTPAKSYFSSPRPWRLTDAIRVVQAGTEATGYYIADLSDGTPDYAAGLTHFPLYETRVVIPPTLMAVRSTSPASDGGFVSGHTNAGYLASFAMAYAMPSRFQGLLLNASAIGQDRIYAGMHTALDVIGGRMLSTALSAAILSDPANSALKAAAYAQGQAFVVANNTTTEEAFEDVDGASLAAHRKEKRVYTARLAYGLPVTGPTDAPATVPKGAEVLLETRLPYLDVDQRREVLLSTAIRSGHALLDDVEGWGRLNLYAAADGFGMFDTDVTVTMDQNLGGFAARDVWRNDIGGVGGLTKEGTGELDLTGENYYRGGTAIDDGVLLAASQNALGRGGVSVNGGTLIDFAPVVLHVGGNYTQSSRGTLQMTVGRCHDGLSRGALLVDGNVKLSGHLQVSFKGPTPSNTSIPLIFFEGVRSGVFDDLVVTGLSGYSYSLSYGPKSVSLTVFRPEDSRRHTRD
jgi:autotransporter-associated beta strand protein